MTATPHGFGCRPAPLSYIGSRYGPPGFFSASSKSTMLGAPPKYPRSHPLTFVRHDSTTERDRYAGVIPMTVPMTTFTPTAIPLNLMYLNASAIFWTVTPGMKQSLTPTSTLTVVGRGFALRTASGHASTRDLAPPQPGGT